MGGTPEHEKNRLKVCAPCGGKIIFGKQKSAFLVTKKLENLIKKHLNSEYNKSDSKFPSGICGTCRTTLNEREREIVKRDLPNMPNYNRLHFVTYTRGCTDVCGCYICMYYS